MSPPLPPSPPSGPPRGTCASRRNEMLPAPPSPAFTFSCASSTNSLTGEPRYGGVRRTRQPGRRRSGLLGHALGGFHGALLLADLADAVEAVDVGDRRPVGGNLLPSGGLHPEPLAEN